jgi:hypothetical protein
LPVKLDSIQFDSIQFNSIQIRQWWWNWSCSSFKSANINNGSNEAFAQAATQAIEHHAERHPSRPLHITKRP